MKLATRKINIEKSENLGEEYGMQISKENEHVILNLLRSQMYSDPVAAICREITSNARDSHTEAGKIHIPIEINLPTNQSPQLEIIDYGVGISPDRAKNVFVQFGNSTKRNTDDQIGGFGLGGKTPLAYTDSFVIKSIFDGIETIYSVYIDETTKGKMQVLHSEPTGKENGVTIQIPIKKQDFNLFAKEIKKNTRFWETKPIIRQNGIPLDIPNEDIPESFFFPHLKSYIKYQKKDHWRYSNTSICEGDHNCALVIVDGIPYKIDSEKLKLDPSCQKLCSKHLRLFFNTGELSLSSNRETLYYNQQTKKAIEARLKELFNHIQDISKDFLESKYPKYIDLIYDLYIKNKFSFQKDFDLYTNLIGEAPKYKIFDYQKDAKRGVSLTGTLKNFTANLRLTTQKSLPIYRNLKSNNINSIPIGVLSDLPVIYFNDISNKKVSNNIWEQIKKDPDSSLFYIFITFDDPDYTYEEAFKDNPEFEELGIKKLSDDYKIDPKIVISKNVLGKRKHKNEITVEKLSLEFPIYYSKKGINSYLSKSSRLDLNKNQDKKYYILKKKTDESNGLMCDLNQRQYNILIYIMRMLGGKKSYIFNDKIKEFQNLDIYSVTSAVANQKLSKKNNWEHLGIYLDNICNIVLDDLIRQLKIDFKNESIEIKGKALYYAFEYLSNLITDYFYPKPSEKWLHFPSSSSFKTLYTKFARHEPLFQKIIDDTEKITNIYRRFDSICCDYISFIFMIFHQKHDIENEIKEKIHNSFPKTEEKRLKIIKKFPIFAEFVEEHSIRSPVAESIFVAEVQLNKYIKGEK